MKLKKAITAHGEEIKELIFRAPTADEIMELGLPFSTDGESALPRMKVVGRYIVKLAEIPMSSVKQLSPLDLMEAVGEVLGFFGESATEEATPPSQ